MTPTLSLLLALATFDAGSAGRLSWVEQGETFAELTAFHVRVDVHAGEGAAGSMSRDALRQQMEAALREAGIAVVESPEGARGGPHGLGFLVLDVHTLQVDKTMAVSWTLHASQIVRLLSGGSTFASTWEVGDLVQAPPDRIANTVRDSLGPALKDFTAAYRAARGVEQPAPPPRGGPKPTPPPSPSSGTSL